MAFITGLFTPKTKVLSSTPPEAPLAPPINELRLRLSSLQCETLTGQQYLDHYKRFVTVLDLEDDYLTAFHACLVNPNAKVLFSQEIQRKIDNRESLFKHLPPVAPKTAPAPLVRSHGGILPRFTEAETGSVQAHVDAITVTCSSPGSPPQSPLLAAALDDAAGSSSSMSGSQSAVVASSLDDATTVTGSSSRTLLSRSSSPVADAEALEMTAHSAASDDSRGSSPLSVLESVYPEASPLVQNSSAVMVATATEVKAVASAVMMPTESLSAAQTVKIAQRQTELNPDASLIAVAKAANAAKEFVIKLQISEAMPKELRPIVNELLENPERSLKLLLDAAYKTETTDMKMWVGIVTGHIQTLESYKKADAILKLNSKFLGTLDAKPVLKKHAPAFLKTEEAKGIIQQIQSEAVTESFGFAALERALENNLPTYMFLDGFSPFFKKTALTFIQNVETQSLLAAAKAEGKTAQETLAMLRKSFNVKQAQASFIKSLNREEQVAATRMQAEGLLTKVAEAATSKGFIFPQILKSLEIYFDFMVEPALLINASKPISLTEIQTHLKDPSIIAKLIEAISQNKSDAEIQRMLSYEIALKTKVTPKTELQELFPEIASILEIKPRAPVSGWMGSNSLLETLSKAMNAKLAQEILKDASEALETNDGSKLSSYTTKDLELLPEDIRAQVLARGFDITDWDEL